MGLPHGILGLSMVNRAINLKPRCENNTQMISTMKWQTQGLFDLKQVMSDTTKCRECCWMVDADSSVGQLGAVSGTAAAV